MTTAVRINNTDKYVVFTNIYEFIENLKDAQFYLSDDEFVGTDTSDDKIKISFEFKGCPKLICYIRNKRESAPQFKISTENIDELINNC